MNLESKVSEQARKLGGGWRIDQDIIPIVVLTIEEADLIIKKLERVPLYVKYKNPDGEDLIFHIKDIEIIYPCND